MLLSRYSTIYLFITEVYVNGCHSVALNKFTWFIRDFSAVTHLQLIFYQTAWQRRKFITVIFIAIVWWDYLTFQWSQCCHEALRLWWFILRLRDLARHNIFMVLTKCYPTCICSGPTGVTRRQFLVNVLLDVMVQDTGFTVRVLVAKKTKQNKTKHIFIVIFIAVPQGASGGAVAKW